MPDLFKLVLSMSLSGSALILLLLLSNPLYRDGFSKAWQYYVWLIVLLRLVIPYSPEFGLANRLFQETAVPTASVAEAYIPAGPADRPVVLEPVPGSGTPVTPAPAAPRNEAAPPWDPWSLAGMVWLAGAFLLLAFKVYQYAPFSHGIRKSARAVTDERVRALLAKTAAGLKAASVPRIFESERVGSPMLMGIMRPAVFLPAQTLDMDDSSLSYVFRHELTHFKRRDLAYKWFAELCLCIHWFNPLVYVMSNRLSAMCELSCDEAVAKELDATAKKEYGGTLLMAVSQRAECKPGLLTITLCEDKKSLKERLSAILKAGPKSQKAIVLSVAVAAVLFGAAVCLGAFSSGGLVPPKPLGSLSGQPDAKDGRPYLTWEKVKELTGGSLGYFEIRDSCYSEEIGSGLLILRYPIENAPGFFLVASSMGPDAEPIAIRLGCEEAGLSLDLNTENLGIMMDLYNDGGAQEQVNWLFYDQIPVPPGAKTYGNILYLSGRAPDEIAQDYQKMLQNNGWELADALGMKRYYKKTADGGDLAISVLCFREGGAQDADIPTVIRFALEPPPYEGENKREQEEQEVRSLVESFGQALKMVPLIAPADVAAKSIGENYGKYVTPELLARWQKDPENAPGRVASSPWPERIEILSVEQGPDSEYTVRGEIIEVTSVELMQGGAAAKRPVTLTVQKADGGFLISDMTVGRYEQRGPVVYENTQYGFSFYLPKTWEGYRVVEEEWQGTAPGGDASKPAGTGPKLLIRNPKWTEKDPYQDIPIMVFTLEQWNTVQKGDLVVSAAPFGPRKLGGNSQYVFALPPRYNYAFPTGYEEVEDILEGNPLWAN